MSNAEALAKELAKAGFKAQHSAWNRDYFLKELPDDHVGTIYLIHHDDDPLFIDRLKGTVRSAMPNTPLKVFTAEEILKASPSAGTVISASISGPFTATIIYRNAV